MPGHDTTGIGEVDKSDWLEANINPYWISKRNYQLAATNPSDSTKVFHVAF